MSDYVFVADVFVEQVLGGGELSNEELINILSSRGHEVQKVLSNQVSVSFLEENRDKNFIIGNFIFLSEASKRFLEQNSDVKYVIYEHDHKYLRNRNPSEYDNYKAPPSHIVNYNFYKNAAAVLCQTSFHKAIAQTNLNLENIKSVGGNLWSLDILNYLSKLSLVEKNDKVAIMDSPINHKNTYGAVKYCEYNNLSYELIPKLPYREFLKRMSQNKKLAFFPKTPETCSRILVESRMMNMGVLTNDKCGAKYEEWFRLKGQDMINKVMDMREDITNIVEACYE